MAEKEDLNNKNDLSYSMRKQDKNFYMAIIILVLAGAILITQKNYPHLVFYGSLLLIASFIIGLFYIINKN